MKEEIKNLETQENKLLSGVDKLSIDAGQKWKQLEFYKQRLEENIALFEKTFDEKYLEKIIALKKHWEDPNALVNEQRIEKILPLGIGKKIHDLREKIKGEKIQTNTREALDSIGKAIDDLAKKFTLNSKL